jgi:hypothetical protein
MRWPGKCSMGLGVIRIALISISSGIGHCLPDTGLAAVLDKPPKKRWRKVQRNLMLYENEVTLSGDGRTSDVLPNANITITFDGHFASAECGPYGPLDLHWRRPLSPCGDLSEPAIKCWCGRWESNPHSLRNRILSQANKYLTY